MVDDELPHIGHPVEFSGCVAVVQKQAVEAAPKPVKPIVAFFGRDAGNPVRQGDAHCTALVRLIENYADVILSEYEILLPGVNERLGYMCLIAVGVCEVGTMWASEGDGYIFDSWEIRRDGVVEQQSFYELSVDGVGAF